MPEPRHVVVLATDFRPMIGGVAEHLHNIAHHLARRVPVTVMTTVRHDDERWEHAYRLEQLPPLPERRLGRRAGDGVAAIRKFHTGAYFAALSAYARRVVARVQRLGGPAPLTQLGAPLVVPPIIIGSWDTASHFWCAACRGRGIPYLIFAHGVEVVLPLYGRLPRWRREDFAGADRVLACSEATAGLALDRLGLTTRPVVIHPAVGPRPPEDEIRTRAAALRIELSLPDDPAVFSLGRLVRRKGFDLVLRAVRELSEEGRAVSYIIAGDGPERAALEALSRELGIVDRVRMLGGIDDLTKWAAYDVCDVFIMPNRLLGGLDWEGFGIVFLEAALAGRPTIGGMSGGASDAIDNEITGLLVDPEQPGALTQALGRLLKDDGLRRRLGAAGRQRAGNRYGPDSAAERLAEQLDWH